MDANWQLRAFLKEFTKVQANPISDRSLVERARTEATIWLNAVHMQHRRISHPVVDPDAPGDEVFRAEIDLHFLVVALTRLRRAVGLTCRVTEVQAALFHLVNAFDTQIPSLVLLRNVAEHFDDYTTGAGRSAHVKRAQLQAWSLSSDDPRGLVWTWLGVELPVDEARTAATNLYRGFLEDSDQYLRKAHG